MSTTTLKQKIVLLLLGIIFTLIFLEVILRIGGFVFNLRQNWSNPQVLKRQENEFRILCIGESTTALGGENSYPSQLQEILNSKGLGQNFTVINKGLVAKTSSDILEQLNDNLDRFQPDLVVGMIGINDPHSIPMRSPWVIQLETFLEKFRVYKFFRLLGSHASHKMGEMKTDTLDDSKKDAAEILSGENNHSAIDHELSKRAEIEKVDTEMINRQIIKLQSLSAQLENSLKQSLPKQGVANINKQLKLVNFRLLWFRMYLGVYYRAKGEYDLAQQYFLAAIAFNPQDFGPYLEMGRIYKELKDYKKAIYFLSKSRILMPKSDLAVLELGRCFNEVGRLEETYKMFNILASKKSIEYWVYPEIGQWFMDHSFYAQAEEVFVKAIQANPMDFFLYKSLAEIYSAQGKIELAQSFQEQFRLKEQTAQGYMPKTVSNYNRIVDAVLKRGIRMICMQYPRRSIQPLKGIFKQQDKITFVENRSNFNEALARAEYSKYFSDNFGADFGHCTRLGNRLIAEHLAQEIVLSGFHTEL